MLALPVALGLGCYAGPARMSYGVAYANPPAPPAWYVSPDPRDGYVWVDGNWYWGYDQWSWRPGYWVTARPGYAYEQGRWYGRQWRDGHWRPAGRGVVVRDHRSDGVVAPPARVSPSRSDSPARGGAVVRDHRR